MQMAELVERSGVALPTIKYYLRVGLLMPGETTSATRATYGDEHLRRLALVRALIGVAGLPVARVRAIVSVLDDPGPSLFETLGTAIGALPPYERARQEGNPRARRALALLGQSYEAESAAVTHLESALAGLESAGIAVSDERLRAYAGHVRTIATDEISAMPTDRSADALEYAVLGTILHEPLILALRRLAHQDLYLERNRSATPSAAASTAGPPTGVPPAR